jgi:hypothetical protein
MTSKLEKLYLQEVSMTNDNPICKMVGYRDTMLKTMPTLKSLDGIKRECEVRMFTYKVDFSN